MSISNFLHTILLKAVFILALSCSALSAAAEPFHFKYLDKQKWNVLETKNFTIYANLKPKGLEDAGRQLEKFHAFSRLFLYNDGNEGIPAKKARLFLTSSDKTWKSLGLPKNSVSLYSTIPGNGAVIFARTEGFFGSQGLRRANEGRAVLLSAIASEMLASEGLSQSLPNWFVTGYSFYLATYREPKDGIMLGDPTAHQGRILGLTNSFGSGFLGLNTKELMRPEFTADSRVSEKSSTRQRLKASNSFYMRSFVAVHYFYADKARRAKMFKYINRVERGEDYEVAFRDEFAYDFEELDKRLYKYMTGRAMMARVFAHDTINPLLKLPPPTKSQPLAAKEFFRKFVATFTHMGDQTFSPADKKEFLTQVETKYGKLFEFPKL